VNANLEFRFNSADIKLCVLDSTALPNIDKPIKELVDKNTLIVVNKVDQLKEDGETLTEKIAELGSGKSWKISCLTQEGVSQFVSGLEQEVKKW
jgi:predicted GTPase